MGFCDVRVLYYVGYFGEGGVMMFEKLEDIEEKIEDCIVGAETAISRGDVTESIRLLTEIAGLSVDLVVEVRRLRRECEEVRE